MASEPVDPTPFLNKWVRSCPQSGLSHTSAKDCWEVFRTIYGCEPKLWDQSSCTRHCIPLTLSLPAPREGMWRECDGFEIVVLIPVAASVATGQVSQKVSYLTRDLLLYAVGIGSHNLRYTYEYHDDFEAFP